MRLYDIPEELQQIIYDAGIVGAGGAGFPHKKIAPGIKQIVINAAECEPLMMVDHHIFRKHFRAIVETMNLMLDAIGAERGNNGHQKGKNMALFGSRNIEGTGRQQNKNPWIRCLPGR